MRPFILSPLFLSLQTLPGVGPKNLKLYEKLCGTKIIDLLCHLPVGLIDRRYSPEIKDAESGRIATMTVLIDAHIPSPTKNKPYRVKCSDDTGVLDLIFFHPRKSWLEQQLPIHEKRVVSGRIEYFQGIAQMSHPDAIATVEEKETLQTVEPVYALTAGLNHKPMLKAVRAALTHIKPLPEWLNKAHLEREKWATWHDALLTVHSPEDDSALFLDTPTHMRLAYDELLANQLAIQLVRQHQHKKQGRILKCPDDLRDKALAELSFELTNAQKKVINEINTDMNSENRMLRLLQGDVGSGKTIVAFFAMLNAVGSSTQAAIMAPTEILARQHQQSLSPLAEKLGLTVATLTGRDKGKKRQAILDTILSGDADIIIGTHALFQDDVIFKDLGMVVIDEQHRFGVHQRLQLSNKGKRADVLVMTATPIPRTLTLTAYGDMETSRITEKPAGRKPIDTRLISNDRIEEIAAGLKRKIADGARAYWVCPLIEESEKLDLAAAQERFDMLLPLFGDRLGLIHGRMKGDEKDTIMAQFAAGDLDVLVATTVIEVGVNVPEATIMVIEHAERFGLSQLHQLRGRVGRGDDMSICLLLYAARLGKIAEQRLKIIRDTEDGFIIAEEDLRLRGAGEILGTKQSGLPEFHMADLAVHGELLKTACDDASLILHNDPELSSERGEALRVLLYLFERDSAIKYLQSG